MEDQQRTSISSSPMAIHTKVCPCGNVYLYVGHTCVYLRQEEFLDVAQVIQAAERYVLGQEDAVTDERRH
jgi:hypothetical protein